MGVAGAGKTLVGQTLGAAIGWPFYDADDYHTPESVAKMAHGEGLTDVDRAPWLEKLRTLIQRIIASDEHGVLACSALKHQYREALGAGLRQHGTIRFVFLDVPRQILEKRLASRAGHFAGADLLQSQLDTLEPPEDALWVDGTQSPTEIVRRIRSELDV
jgi:gluconokinase